MCQQNWADVLPPAPSSQMCAYVIHVACGMWPAAKSLVTAEYTGKVILNGVMTTGPPGARHGVSSVRPASGKGPAPRPLDPNPPGEHTAFAPGRSAT